MQRYVPIFHFGRTGSTVLAAGLGQHPDAVSLGEIFTIAMERGGKRFDGVEDYLSEVLNHHLIDASRHKVVFFELKNLNVRSKLSSISLEPLLVAMQEVFGPHIVILRRRNTLKRIVSNLKAAHSKVYHLKAGESGSRLANKFVMPVEKLFDFSTRVHAEDLVGLVRKAVTVEQAVCQSVKSIFPQALEIWYETDIEVNPSLGIEKVFDYCELPKFSKIELSFKKTSSGLANDIENYDQVKDLISESEYAWMLK